MSSQNFFGQRISHLRKAAGITQKQLGEVVGLSMQAINDIEKGRRETTQSKLIALAEFFDVPVDYLLGRGLFSNWEQIMKYRDFICEKLQPEVPFARVEVEGQEPKITQIDLKSLDEKCLMLMLSALVERIEIIEEDGKPIFFQFFVLPIYVDDKGDKPSGGRSDIPEKR